MMFRDALNTCGHLLRKGKYLSGGVQSGNRVFPPLHVAIGKTNDRGLLTTTQHLTYHEIPGTAAGQ